MAKNKHASIRYRALDACFRNHRVRYYAKDLIEAVNRALEKYEPTTKGISRATLYADIEFMKSTDGWRAEIDHIKDGKSTYLRYSDPDFSIDKGPLNHLESAQLKEALGVLSKFKGLPQFEWMEEVVAKLDQGIRPEQGATIISFDANQYLKGIEWLGVIYNAVLYQKVLCITYKDFKAETPYEVVFHPYHLKQYNNRWFAFGFNRTAPRPLQTIALDRIGNVTEQRDTYIPNASINSEEYFEDIVGVTKPDGGKVQPIQLRFAPDRAGYVQTKPLHGSQKSKVLGDGHLEVTLNLMPNRELMQLLLSFGNSVEVVSPILLRDEVIAEVEQLVASYRQTRNHLT